MPSLLKIKDSSAFPAPKSVYNWRVYALAISASMGSSMFGYDSAFIGGTITLPSFKSRFGLDSDSKEALASLSANIVSTFQAGCFFGAILVSYFTEKFGRRIPLVSCGILFNLGVVLQLASSGNVGLIYGGRALTGLAVGASSLIVPQYIAEWSPPAIRGRLVGVFEMVLQMSQIIGFWVNYGVNEHVSASSDAQWRIPFSLQLIPGTLLVVLMLLQHESPRWLIKNGQRAKAIDNLSFVRKLAMEDAYIQWEADTIEEQLRHEAEVGDRQPFLVKIKEVFLPGNRNRLFIGMSLMMLQNLSGINALNYYSPVIFKSIGFSGTSVGLLATGVFGIVKCTATILFMIFGIDRLGRRKSMIIGSSGAIVAMYYLAAYTKLSGSFETPATRDAGAYIAIVMVYIFAIFYAISWNGIPWVFCAEVFPTGIRSISLVFTTCVQWLGQFIITYSTPYMMANITYGTFLFFGSSVVCGLIIVYLFMPETKGFSLEEMDILFSIRGFALDKRRGAESTIADQREAEQTVVENKVGTQHMENTASV
ncbi:hypothetical protein N7481_012983 [Penicillium waksmanii]|uniref:uncharacterized protein n=1 Tax=Penicillium waksmanii TaxID=69791 RepID=UPI0025487187|nr:uncharacterized protein N7481_012983 [Penicillium waksmanii]KAJ5966269.1 hypothetical protein N7481_012983 [Penicillium waksmanii]